MRMLLVVFLVIMAAMTGCSKDAERKAVGAAKAGGMEGATAPDFTVNDLAGKPVTLSQLKGNVLVVNFWATWCPPCREEIPSMMKLNQAMNGKPYQMLALSIDEGGKEAIETFFKNTGMTLPAYLDGEQKIGKMYGITGVPETFIIDKKGIIQKKIVGGIDWSAPDLISYLDGLVRQ